MIRQTINDVIPIAEVVVPYESPRCRTPALLYVGDLRSSASSGPSWWAPQQEEKSKYFPGSGLETD